MSHDTKSFRMLAGFAVIIALLLGNGWFLYDNFEKTNAKEKWVAHTAAVMSELDQVISYVKDAETGVRGFAITQQESYLEPYHSGITGAWNHYNKLVGLTADNRQQQSAIKVLDRLMQERFKILAAYLESISDGKGMKSVSVSEGKIVMDNLRSHVENMKQEERDLMRSRTVDASDGRFYFLVSLVVSTFFSVATFCVAFYLFQRHVTTTDLEMRERAHEAWLKEMVADVSQRLGGDLTLQKAGEQLLAFFSDKFQIPAAQVYVGDGLHFRPVASYGIQHERATKDNTLLSQAMGKASLWQINDVPAEYWQLSSALGNTKPKTLAFYPFTFQGKLIAVIEMGAFHALTKEQEEALSHLNEAVAVNLSAAQSRDHMQRLLETTQQQAEELQAQQEELKTNNEELEQQTRALESQQQALNTKNRELETSRREVEAKASELQRSSQYKSEFLAKMSHELRTPLNGLLILSTLLAENKDKNLSDQQIQFARSINNAGEDLLLLINDILDLSKIEARKLSMRPEEFMLDHMMEQLKKTFAVQAKVKNLQLDLEMAANVYHLKVFTDRQRVEQILRNFLSNSLKFTEKGSITIVVEAPNDARTLKITVRDTGIGIRAEKKAQIFEAFEQADSSISRKFGGTGLGLTISRELATLLGGTISVESEEGHGSAFTLQIPSQMKLGDQVQVSPIVVSSAPSLPAKPATEAMLNNSEAKRQAHEILSKVPTNTKTILIVEDDHQFRASVVEAARNYGFTPIEAVDGEIAFAILQEHTPSAVMLDIKLPGISGLGLLEMVKQMPHLRHIPIHMISALDYQHNALRMGALGYLTKPVTLEKVRSALGRIEGMLSQKVRRVLVIEDDEKQSMAIKELISGNDVEVVPAKTGKRAVEQLKTGNFDCIILDLTLPDVSGFDLLSELNSLEISLPPIVIYTGKDLTSVEEDYLRRYSESIIIKGVRSPERLLDEVNLFLHRVESLLPPEKKEMLSHLRSQGQSFDGKTVLLVDDDLRNVFALTNALESKGFNVRIAKNGQEALDALAEHTDINITLMDIMMPVMDGFEAMRRIRASTDPRIKKMPVIALTAKAMREDHEKCIEAGASDYLPKPVNLDNLMTVLKVWMPQERIYT